MFEFVVAWFVERVDFVVFVFMNLVVILLADKKKKCAALSFAQVRPHFL